MPPIVIVKGGAFFHMTWMAELYFRSFNRIVVDHTPYFWKGFRCSRR